MKKALSLILALVLCLSLCACGSKPKDSDNETISEAPVITEEQLVGTWQDIDIDGKSIFGEYIILSEGGIGKAREDLEKGGYRVLEWSIKGEYVRIEDITNGIVEVFTITTLENGSVHLTATDRSSRYKLRY